jgi:hypothetical protein
MNDRKAPGPSFEIPDLEIAPPPVSKRSAPDRATRTVAAALTPEAAAFGLEISLPDLDDDDDSLQKGANVELSIGTSPQATRRQLENWPTGSTRPVDQLPIDPANVTLTAGYGDAPNSAFLAPSYAYRVLARRTPLKRALAVHHAELSQAELLRDTQLIQLSTQLRPALEANDAFRRLLDPIRELERLARERNQALLEADAGYRQQMATFDADLGLLRDAILKAQATCDEKAGLANGTESLLRRVEAKHQRIQIEIRGVMDVARQALGPTGGDMPAAQAAQLAELQARATALEPELTHAKASHTAASKEQDQAAADARRLLGQAQKLERQKNNAGGTLQKQLSVRAASVSEAEKQQREALAEVARAVLLARGTVAVPEPLLQALREHDKAVDALAIRLETLVRALDSYDRERVKQGVIIALSACGVVVLSILLKAML